jgi:signal transduction histidine kinase
MLDLLRLTPVSSEQGRYLRAMQGSAESLLTIINDILVSPAGLPGVLHVVLDRMLKEARRLQC